MSEKKGPIVRETEGEEIVISKSKARLVPLGDVHPRRDAAACPGREREVDAGHGVSSTDWPDGARTTAHACVLAARFDGFSPLSGDNRTGTTPTRDQ